MEMFVQGQEKTMTHLSDTAHVYQIHECMKGGGGRGWLRSQRLIQPSFVTKNYTSMLQQKKCRDTLVPEKIKLR